MSDKPQTEASGPSWGLLLGLGLATGAVLGLALARRAAQRSQGDIIESVEELRERTQRVLNELSENVADLLTQTRAQMEQAVEAGRGFAALQTQTLEETIGPGPEEA